MFFRKKDQLKIYREYTHYGSYDTSNRLRKSNLKAIQNRFEKRLDVIGVYITSKFNGYIYPVFDLDSNEHLELFKNIYVTTPYVIFETSKGHYWGIVDNPTKNIKDIFEKDPSWKVCNDQDYVNFSINKGRMFLRGLYENYDRKPYLCYTNGEISIKFQLFINKIKDYYNKEGFEFSVLRYNSTELIEELMIRKRAEKINKIKNRTKVLG